MKFKKEIAKSEVPFYTITEGEVFESDSKIYLKIETLDGIDWTHNAVDIQSGEIKSFNNMDLVHKALVDMTVRVYE